MSYVWYSGRWPRLFILVALLFSCATPETTDRPNIVWITAEDMSPVLGYLGDTYAHTPNLDALAAESVIYTRAFATSPVCSPSRAALINGMMASAQGAHQMRSAFPLPSSWQGFPAVLRRAGYYTTNNVKTDYNSGNAQAIIAASLDENSNTADWTGREEDQPFFSIFNHMVTHQSRSMVWPYEQFLEDVQSQLTQEEIHDPSEAPVPPYYPDTPLIRQTIARFYDCVTVMDKQVGAILSRLESEGLLDDTIIFFYSDHGTGLPRHKRTMLDSGLHVPLLVRFPPKYQHLAPVNPGEQLDRLVSFDDFGPTVLSLLELDIPEYMTGIPFLGSQAGAAREHVFAHRDRVDEAIDMVRSVRNERYMYVRTYMPHLSNNQQTAWPDQGEIRHAFYEMAEQGGMTGPQAHFAGPSRAVEELYDTQSDPLNLNNLAASPEHRDVLASMRSTLREHIIVSRDLGFIPEIEMSRAATGRTPFEWARTDSYDLEGLLAAAEAVGADGTGQFRASLTHANPGVRYWGAVGYSAAPSLTDEDLALLQAALEDSSPAVQVEAAAALMRHDDAQQALNTLVALTEHEDLTVVMHAARAIELAGEKARPARAKMQALQDQYGTDLTDPGMFIGFAATGFLNRLDP